MRYCHRYMTSTKGGIAVESPTQSGSANRKQDVLLRTTVIGGYREFRGDPRWWSVFRVRAGRPCREFLRIFALSVSIWLAFVAMSGSSWSGPHMAETWVSCALVVGLGLRQAIYG